MADLKNVDQQVIFFLEAQKVMMDFKRGYTIQDLQAVDVENSILERISQTAIRTITSAPYDDVKKAVALSYMRFRPGLPESQSPDLFFRISHIGSMVMTMIDEVCDLKPAKKARKSPVKPKSGTNEAPNPPADNGNETTPPEEPGLGGYLDDQGGVVPGEKQ